MRARNRDGGGRGFDAPVKLARDAEQRRRLEYERQSALQREEVRREIEERRLFEEWKRRRAAGGTARP
jgi:hypothetical protein